MRYVPHKDKAFKKAKLRPCSELQQLARSQNFEFGRFVRDTKWVSALASDLRFKHLKYSLSCDERQAALLHKAWVKALGLRDAMEEIKNCLQAIQAHQRDMLKKPPVEHGSPSNVLYPEES